jgi:transcription initiation factor TFIID subunit 5
MGHSGTVYSTVFSPDNQYLFSAAEDGYAKLWDINTKHCVASYYSTPLSSYSQSSSTSTPNNPSISSNNPQLPIWCLDVAQVGFMFATGSYDSIARLYYTDRLMPLRYFVGHRSHIDTIKFHPNCNYLATGSSDASCRLWDVQTGECVRILATDNSLFLPTARDTNQYYRTGTSGAITAMTIDPEGRLLASGDDMGKISLFDLGTGRIIASFYSDPNQSSMNNQHIPLSQLAVSSLCFSADGEVLASSNKQGSIFLRNIKTHIPPITSQQSSMSSRPSNIQIEAKAPKIYRTKYTTVQHIEFTPRNLLIGVGAYSSPL